MSEIIEFGGREFTEDNFVEWGMEYLQGTDDDIFPMEMFDDYYQRDEPMRIAQAVFNGYDYDYGDSKMRGQFNPNAGYFYINGCGNPVSIEDYQLSDRIKMCLEADFIDFCIDNGYIEEE